jgi:glycosyltransferase involved in cell wall biosynthesis
MRTLAAIPCYNEELAVGSVILKARNYVDAVLVVDDGSTDATVYIAQVAGAKVVTHNKNQGKGAAIKSALRYMAMATDGFDNLVLIDGDAQHDPRQIPMLLKPLQDNTADMVIGYRNLGQMPFYRRFGRVVLDYTTGTRGEANDTQSGFRSLNRKAVEALLSRNLQSEGFSIESEMIMVAKNLALRIKEVPIAVSYGHGKTSTKNPVSHGVGVLGSIIQLITEKRPLLYIGVPGLVLILIGFFFGLKLVQYYNQSGYFSLPFTMLAGFFIVVGTFSTFIGLVLNLISRLLAKTNGRL